MTIKLKSNDTQVEYVLLTGKAIEMYTYFRQFSDPNVELVAIVSKYRSKDKEYRELWGLPEIVE